MDGTQQAGFDGRDGGAVGGGLGADPALRVRSLVEQLGPEGPRAALTFAGQGVDALGELRAALAVCRAARPLVAAASEALGELAASRAFRWSGRVDHGLDPLVWAERPEACPPAGYLASTLVSQPLILIAQIARYRALWARGLGAAIGRGGVVAVTGHSQGIMPAVLVAEAPGGLVQADRLVQFVRWMAWQGLHMAESAAGVVPTGDATPMAAVSGLTAAALQAACDAVGGAAAAEQVHVTLHNTRTRLVVSGAPDRLLALREHLERAPKGPGSAPRITWEWLPVGGPFHSPLMEAGRAQMMRTLAEEGIALDAGALRLEVLDPADGAPLSGVSDLTEALVASQFVRPVRWGQTARRLVDAHGVDVVIDCGPGDGVARLTASAVRGSGAPVLAVATPAGESALFTVGAAPAPTVRYPDFAPGLARLPDGRTVVENRYTRATGHSPIILPGMTPTTVDADIVAAAANAGFTAELAGGGQVTEAVLARRLDALRGLLAPGAAVTFNALYLDRYLWDLHLGAKHAVLDAARAGAPLCGVTISAGIPPVDEAVALLDALADAGLWLNAFKPGTDAQVQTVLRIAEAAPRHTIFVHLEGGKAGGHHSWEDLEALLLANYARLRAAPNVVLCVGGGVGDPARAAALLSGAWAEAHGEPRLPVDAVFVGTVAMACAEATASPAVKAALVAAPGTDAWVEAGAAAGGVTSGKSGLDADIHYLDNAAARCGRLLDAVAGDAEAVAARRDEIIEALARTAKPYFGDLTAMTWTEALERLVALMAVGDGGPFADGPWPDVSFRRRVAAFVRRAEARLGATVSVIDAELRALDRPADALGALFDALPAARTERVHPADAAAFVHLCDQPGKPVPFVSVIDAGVRRRYKADSLWQAQDARFGADAVLVIPGPDAVRGIARADEPVAALLGRFERGVVESLAGDGVVVRERARRHGAADPRAPVAGCRLDVRGDTTRLWATGEDEGGWFDAVGARFAGPAAAFFAAARVVGAAGFEPAPARRLCRAVAGAELEVEVADGIARTLIWRAPGEAAVVRVLAEGEGVALEVRLAPLPGGAGGGTYRLAFAPGPVDGPPVFVTDAAAVAAAVRGLYAPGAPPVALFEAARATVSMDAARARAHGRLTGHPDAAPSAGLAFSLAWPALLRALTGPDLAAGLLRLVHLDQSVAVTAAWPPAADALIEVEARVTRLEDAATGRTIHAAATLTRAEDGAVLARLRSTFFVRAPHDHTLHAVRAREPFAAALDVVDAAAAAFLAEHAWIDWARAPEVGDRLRVEAELVETRPRAGHARFGGEGVVRRGDAVVGRVRGDAAAPVERDPTHPVRALVRALGERPAPTRDTPPRTLARADVRAPQTLAPFAEVGLDHNPIHRSPAFARLAGLDGPIVHGMWTAARLAAFVVREVAGGRAARLLDLDVRFLAPTLPDEALTLVARRVAVEGGALVIEATAAARRGGAEVPVARLRGRVAAPRTAYLFPGQGIQRTGMGMAAYAASAAARVVWDRADACTRERLGFSILEVVRDNPRALVVDGERHVHPEGVLHLTRFTQPAMAVLAMAQVAQLREAGVFVEDAITCGHSVGEYNALSAVNEVLPLEAVVEVVYQRGCVMHRFVPRDAAGRSDYGMGVVRPNLAGLDQAGALALVDAVAAETGGFLQVVNFNVRDRQYAVTGEVAALRALAARLDARRVGPKPAYVEVPGVDVPFHSRVLLDGVDAFRQTLRARLPEVMDPARLVGRYVPNLVAEPFALTRAFAERIGVETGSPIISDLLSNWDDVAADPPRLARALLVELLAYQFASPVRWIETQEGLLAAGVERVIEVGVGYQPTVAGMMRQTAQAVGGSVEVLNVEADAEVVLARDADPVAVVEASAPVEAAVEVAAPAQPVARADAAPVPDRAVPAGEALRALLALQAGVRLEQVRDDETIDALFDGVSSRRNQVLLDVGAEFALGTLDAAHEKPIGALAAEIEGRAGRYAHPGPYLAGAQREALKRVFGRAGLRAADVAAYLEQTYGVGAGWVAAALDAVALGTRAGDSGRGGALATLGATDASDVAAAQAILDRAMSALAARTGAPLAKRAAAGAEGGVVDAEAVRTLEARLLGPDGALARVADALGAALGRAAPEAVRATDEAAALLARVEAEHGADYLAQLAPLFDARRHVPYVGALPFARRDVARLFHGADDADALAGRLALFGATLADTAAWFAARADAATAARLRRVAAGQGGAPATVRPTRPVVEVDAAGAVVAFERPDPAAPDAAAFVDAVVPALGLPADLTAALREGATAPLDLRGRTAVVSGASPGSIALEVVRHLLRGGARVVLTTTTFDRDRRRLYRALYRAEAGPGAELHVVPCNMASFVDVDALVEWLFAEVTEQAGAQVKVLKRPFTPDLLLPFGAVKDLATLDGLGARALVAVRAMLLGVERLVVGVARRVRRVPGARPCHVVLPLSPNHGTFGGDGAYAETKAALEVLAAKWRSERDAWGAGATLCGARIGWVRGTGLMDQNDAVAARLEADHGLRTFSAPEMGLLLAGLCGEAARRAAAEAPLQVDLTAGFADLPDLPATVRGIRADLEARASFARRRAALAAAEAALLGTAEPAPVAITPAPAWPAAEPIAGRIDWPALPADAPGLDRTVVIVGRAEIGPWGSGRARFELEVEDALSPASVLELAWTCGLVRWDADGPDGPGWVDVATGEGVPESALAARYEAQVRARGGIRFIDAAPAGERTARYAPTDLPVHAQVFLDHDFTFAVSDEAEARAFAAADPERTRVAWDGARQTWTVTRLAGAEVRVQRSARLARRVAGLVPDGFDPRRFGVPADMAASVDPVSLFNLIATVDAFVAAGLEPEELLRHVHPARVANTQGAGIGGMASLRRLYQDHLLGAARQGDVLQETLINVAAAYVVQSYVGSYGPMAHPVGACATAAVSLEEAADKILVGKADFVVAGGFDDIGPEGAVGFADMNATADSDEMTAMGLGPDEMSRANDARRRGFVEAQGGGTVLLARGDVALRLGLPVHGVLAWAGSFGDGIQQSIPAPGLGALAAAMGGAASPLGRALRDHGLTADDVAMVYKHDTSTHANDVNENALHHRIQAALGRTPGNPLWVVSQKTLTGHSKGGAAAWQVGGLCDALAAGLVPGNRNLDAVDAAMAPFGHLGFTDETLRLEAAAPRAGLVTSLGFGHVSAVVLVLHPEAFAARLSPDERAAWAAQIGARRAWARRRRADVLMGAEPHFRKRAARRIEVDGLPPDEAEAAVLLDPAARFVPDAAGGALRLGVSS